MIQNTRAEVIKKLISKHPDQPVVLLESQMVGHPSSHRSYLALGRRKSIKAWGSAITTERDGEKFKFESDPWDALKEFRKQSTGMIFGYLGYDLKNVNEQLTSRNRRLLDLPDLWFFEPKHLYLLDPEGKIENVESQEPVNSSHVAVDGVAAGSFRLSDVKPMVEEEEYIRNVGLIQEMIREGRFYELNYSYPIHTRFKGDPFSLYESMRQVSPAPFAAYISDGTFAACCSSPERFLKKEGIRVQSDPIKGTTARSEDPETDQRNREYLLNEKNRAENLMIVDLVRHDLSAISITGSVEVEKLFEIHSFETVHQLISVVTSRVSDQTDPVDVLCSCFPMGSMTGAPKIEVMKAIDELEIYRRGLYSGAIGWIDEKGDFDFNVVIRTALIRNGELYYPAGGAITSDSDPAEEWIETWIKARALTNLKMKEPAKRR